RFSRDWSSDVCSSDLPWLDRLSDYVDGLMDEAEARELRKHLETCDDCRAIEADLRTIVQLAHDAQPIEPARDLWPAILGGISARSEERRVGEAGRCGW